MNKFKKMFDDIHPNEELVKQTKNRMAEPHKKTVKFKIAFGVCVLVFCIGSVYIVEKGFKRMDEPVLLSYAKEIATPQEREFTDEKRLNRKSALSMDRVRSQNLTSRSASYLFQNERNIVYSPLSTDFVLGMLYTKIQGESIQEFHTLLDADAQVFSDQLADIYTTMQGEESIQINNSIWIDSAYDANTANLQEIADQFNASSYYIDFSNENAVDEIRKYVLDKSMQMIEPSITVSDNTAMLLMNVIAMQSPWRVPFQIRDVKEDFHLVEDGTVSINYMEHNFDTSYYKENETYQAIDLFLENGYRMRIVLPHEDEALRTLLQDEETISNMMIEEIPYRDDVKVDFKMPRFSILTNQNLNEMLQSFGIQSMFTSNGDLNRLGENLYIENIVQDAFIEVNEFGLRAAALTQAEVATSSMMEEEDYEKMEMHVNRPFFYIILDSSNQVVFNGTVYDPSK